LEWQVVYVGPSNVPQPKLFLVPNNHSSPEDFISKIQPRPERCPLCAEREARTERLNAARWLHAAAVCELKALPNAALDHASERAENAWLEFVSARWALDAHVKQHRC